MRVAVMQPYFVPYAGYFRLFRAVDLFVVFDCVQFPRRGFVHRNKLTTRTGELDYLTLPLERAPRATRIDALRFKAEANSRMAERIRPFPALDKLAGDPVLRRWLLDLDRPVVDYLIDGLQLVSQRLGVARPIRRSSAFALPARLRGQDRILAILARLGAQSYVNAPGGRSLYDPQRFARAGIALGFLQPYTGPPTSILERLLAEERASLAHEFAAEPALDWAAP